jgi:putative membrane-bound dehydrogenase-like protein
MYRFSYTLCFAMLAATPGVAADAPLPPDKAAAAMKVPEGFRVQVVGSEPRVIKPIAMTLDDRGRLWVVESHSYPNWLRDGETGSDRILIFEDKEGKGRYDCTVFWDKGTNLSGIAVGFGGVWLCATPNLLFIPVKPGEDRPAGAPRVVLDGWSLLARHNVFNGLIWGPDGWLYGLNGITATSRIGKPGTPDKDRVPMNCGVWRYHPTKQRFEPFAWGTTNPWGIDFDDHGEMFITNCVIKHLFHVVPGAHFQRMYGEDLNPHCYGLLESCADHFHWAGGSWTSSRSGQGAHGEAGGGHAHAGCMVYLGDNWPDEYRNHIFMHNIHGSRLNQDVLERKGSGYVAHHGKDFLFAADPWFRGLGLCCGPDGGVYMSDWCDTGECHNYDKTHPFGRIYKVTFGQPKRVAVDLAKLSDKELVELQHHKNDWYVRHARRLLQERAAEGKLDVKVKEQLRWMLMVDQAQVPRRLRALWALYSVGGLDEKTLEKLLGDTDESLRRWAVRLAAEEKVSEAVAGKLAALARKEQAAPVRLALASALQRLDPDLAFRIAHTLGNSKADVADSYLPLMIWYGAEAAIRARPTCEVELLFSSEIPLVRQNTARRLAASGDAKSLDRVAGLLTGVALTDDALLDLVRGLYEALRGQRNLKPPAAWAEAYQWLLRSPNVEVRRKAMVLALIFGDQKALATLRKRTSDKEAALEDRQAALQALIEVRAAELAPLLRDLLADTKLRGSALRGLSNFKDASTPAAIIQHYAAFTDAEKSDAVSTLSSRPEWAHALLDAVDKGKVPRRDLSAFTARQILGLKDKTLAEKLNRVWGTIRPTSGDKTTLLNRYKNLVPPDALTKADRAKGRMLFTKTCAACHTLFGEGGKVGPDLTGSQRANPEYVLTKLLDPSAVVAKDYQVSVIETVNGRLITGIVTKDDGKTVTVQMQNELLTLPKGDIQERKQTTQSIMPEGMLDKLTDIEVRDLIAYLAGKDQAPLPPQEK